MILPLRKAAWLSGIFVLLFSSCQTIDLYEQVQAVPNHEWKAAFRPGFDFVIKDTASPYQLNFIIRHDDRYAYNNIWVNLYAKAPGDSTQRFMLEFPLASKEKGWLGTAMDDLIDHRILIDRNFKFTKPGNYHFEIEQVMREDPLSHVYNVGIRLQKGN